MAEFHNPYHFVPLRKSPDLRHGDWIDEHVTHERHVPGNHTGVITCEITAETPVLCGNRQEVHAGLAKLIHPFEIDGQPAIPGSQLRGMISSVAEAVSGSAMRILADSETYSYRNRREDGLTALGMVVVRDGKHYIYPLASPNYWLADPAARPCFESASWSPLPSHKGGAYDQMFPAYRPKISFGTERDLGRASFLDTFKSSQSPHDGPFYGITGNLMPHRHDKPNARGLYNLHFMFGEVPDARNNPAVIRRWNDIPEGEKMNYTRGVLRVLGGGPGRTLPGKKHEFFLIFSAQDQEAIENGEYLFPISHEALERFNQLGEERAKSENAPDTPEHLKLPLGPNGVPRSKEGGPHLEHDAYHLKHGEVVFIRPSTDGLEVSEVSISGIWRDRVEIDPLNPSAKASMRQFLEENGMLDLLPWGPGREKLTLAEQLFGTVSHKKLSKEQSSQQALGGRVCIGNAKSTGGPGWMMASTRYSNAQKGINLVKIPLLNLSSPKPPCPSLYFKPKQGDGAYIQKRYLNPLDHIPQGRKFYLRRPKDGANTPGNPHFVGGENLFVHSHILENPDRRARIANQHQSVEKFIAPETKLTFDIRFTNLSGLELNLLLYALSPTPDFRHQIGHGKPLGLGQMEVAVVSIKRLHTHERYSARNWGAQEGIETIRDVAAELNRSREAYRSWAGENGLSPALVAMELLGNPARVTKPVHYPQVPGIAQDAANFHEEHFKHFMANDDEKNRTPGQFLRPLVDHNGRPALTLPTISREQALDPPNVGYKPLNLAELRVGEELEGKFQAAGQMIDLNARNGFVAIAHGAENRLFLHITQTPNNTLPPVGSLVRVRVITNPQKPQQLMATMLDVNQPSGNA